MCLRIFIGTLRITLVLFSMVAFKEQNFHSYEIQFISVLITICAFYILSKKPFPTQGNKDVLLL